MKELRVWCDPLVDSTEWKDTSLDIKRVEDEEFSLVHVTKFPDRRCRSKDAPRGPNIGFTDAVKTLSEIKYKRTAMPSYAFIIEDASAASTSFWGEFEVTSRCLHQKKEEIPRETSPANNHCTNVSHPGLFFRSSFVTKWHFSQDFFGCMEIQSVQNQFRLTHCE
ncbi:hypothetical protein PROFUN_04304 [Planoprotostelium fungivorum]|uniref:Uncharacterized protein n=1 Tax=Planoprotostelium fungivorum TaxID=1890364 RepID=A0A2P6NV70_9EUKA|nr:hypothetical protein PROFUN_04304 [Planoprotostelium fungivorum]